jgi:hypothetical protein
MVGSWTEFAGWQRVYETPEAVEVDEANGFSGTRRRVFYDEVQLVTYHRYIGWALAVVAAVLATGVGMVEAVAALAGEPKATVVIFLFALPPLALLVVRVVVKVDAVTVYGRRTQARVCFWLRKGRAREVFQRLCARVRHAQERAAREAGGGPKEVAS